MVSDQNDAAEERCDWRREVRKEWRELGRPASLRKRLRKFFTKSRHNSAFSSSRSRIGAQSLGIAPALSARSWMRVVLLGPPILPEQIRATHAPIDQMKRLNFILRTNLRPLHPRAYRHSSVNRVQIQQFNPSQNPNSTKDSRQKGEWHCFLLLLVAISIGLPGKYRGTLQSSFTLLRCARDRPDPRFQGSPGRTGERQEADHSGERKQCIRTISLDP